MGIRRVVFSVVVGEEPGRPDGKKIVRDAMVHWWAVAVAARRRMRIFMVCIIAKGML